jgi:cephalosporin hydroxylase
MSEVAKFFAEVAANIEGLQRDHDVQALARVLIREVTPYKYAYNFTWLGRPIIQFPQDMVAMQELIWRVKPQVVLETGVAHGGSILYYASLLELLGGDRMVIGIDVDVREHNRREIEAHPMFKRVQLIEGSSVAPATVETAKRAIHGRSPVLVVLDSNHTHEHVLAELRAYAPLVGKDSYLVVMDTLVEYMPDAFFADRPWGKGNNPATAVAEFLRETDRFVVDAHIDTKLLLTVAPGGWLRATRD